MSSYDPAFDHDRLHPRDTRRNITVEQARRAGELDAMADVAATTFAELERVRGELEDLAEELVTFAARRFGHRDGKWRLAGLLGGRVVELVDSALYRAEARGPAGAEQAGRDRVALAVADAIAAGRISGSSHVETAKRAAEVALGLRGAL